MESVMRKYGWKPSKPDPRDHKLAIANPELYKTLPASVDLRSLVPEVLNQGELSSCTAHALSMAVRIARIKQGLTDIPLSRLFIYFNERLVEGTINEDCGAQLRDGAKVIARYGVPDESLWQYIDSNLYVEPTQDAYKAAIQDEVLHYLAVNQSLNEMKLCLHEGFPFVFGATLFPEFESDQVAATGIVPMPTGNNQPIGGHAIIAVGYDDKTQLFTVLNSWGNQWGDHGYCYFPYDYLTNLELCTDLWTIRTIAPTDADRKWIVPTISEINS